MVPGNPSHKDGKNTMESLPTPTVTNNTEIGYNRDNIKNNKKKPRFSKAKKRELKQLRLHQEEEERKLHKKTKNRKRTRAITTATTTATATATQPKNNKKSSKNEQQRDAVDQILYCAEKSLFTNSIVVENKVNNPTTSTVSNETGATGNDENTNYGDTTNTATLSSDTDQRLIVEIISGCNLSERDDHDESSSSPPMKQQKPTNQQPEPSLMLPLSSLAHNSLFTARTTTCTIKVQPLLVLDLNGILCHRDRKRKRLEFWHKLHANPHIYTNSTTTTLTPPWNLRPPIGNVANSAIIPRTDLLDFLHYLDKHFCLAIWTSAKPKTAKKLLNLLLSGEKDNNRRGGHNQNDSRGIRSRLLFVWSQTQCTTIRSPEKEDSFKEINSDRSGTEIDTSILVTKETEITTTKTSSTTSDPEATSVVLPTDGSSCPAKKNDDEHSFDDSVVFEKHLPKIWEAYPLWSANNTLLIDDSPEKCPLAIANAIHPPPLHGRYPPQMRPRNSRNKNEGDGTTPSRSSPWFSSDEDNEDQQAGFFRKLVSFWTERPHAARKPWTAADNKISITATTIATDQDDMNEKRTKNESRERGTSESAMTNAPYYEFLRKNARGYMGWRENQQTNDRPHSY